jgi:uncharacterized protein YigA (DUF484 family)
MRTPDILRTNDAIARTFGKIEADIEACAEAEELFARLLWGSQLLFAIPFVWITLLEKPEAEPLIAPLERAGLSDRVNRIAAASFLEIVPDAGRPLLAGGDLRPFFRLLPPRIKYMIRSVAIAPLTLKGCLIGSLNHGDIWTGRYRPGMDTALLDHLARRVSDKISRLLPASPDAAEGR